MTRVTRGWKRTNTQRENWLWLSCVFWWKWANSLKTHYVYLIHLNWGGGLIAYSLTRKQTETVSVWVCAWAWAAGCECPGWGSSGQFSRTHCQHLHTVQGKFVCHFTWPKETAISVTLGTGVLHMGTFMPTTHISSGLHLTLIYSLKLWLPPHRFPTSILYLYEFHTPSWAYWITSTVSASVCPALATFVPVTLGITNSHTGEWTACPFFSFMTPVHKRTR